MQSTFEEKGRPKVRRDEVKLNKIPNNKHNISPFVIFINPIIFFSWIKSICKQKKSKIKIKQIPALSHRTRT